MITPTSNKKIVWLASFPKSGNTWLRLFLYSYLQGLKQIEPNEAVKNQLIDSSANLYKKYVDFSLQKTSKEFLIQVAKARCAVQKNISCSSGSAVTTIKTHTQHVNWNNSPTFDFSTAAGAIYIVRNPLDVVISLAPQIGSNIDDAIKQLNSPNFALAGQGNVTQCIGNWSSNILSWYNNKQIPTHFIRYEDMLRTPYTTFGNALRFLKIESNRSRLENAISATNFNKLKKIEKEKGFVEASNKSGGFFRNGMEGSWRDVLSKKQIKTIIDSNKEVMGLFDYSL